MKVITLNNDDFISQCYKLTNQLSNKPDLVVGILDGGGYVVDQIKKLKKYENIHFDYLKLQRKSNLKRNNVIVTLLKWIPYKISNGLRIIESNRANKSIQFLNLGELQNQKLDLDLAEISNKSYKNILLVDDAIDTGKTMFVIKNNLRRLFPNTNIEVGVISWTLKESIIKPDYYIFKEVLIRYPWSKDYKGKDFEK